MAAGSRRRLWGPLDGERNDPRRDDSEGNVPESEKDGEFQEHEKILSPDFLSVAKIPEMLAEGVDGVQQKLEKFLYFKSLQTCLKEASLLDYYVSGFLWARRMDFSIIQYSKFMTLLDMVLHNLRNFSFLKLLFSKKFIIEKEIGTSLVAPWLRIRLPMQGTRVRSLVWEDPAYRGPTKSVRHNY